MPMVLDLDLSVRLHRRVTTFLHTRRVQLPDGDLEGHFRTSRPLYESQVPSVACGVLASSDRTAADGVASVGRRVERSFLPTVEAVTDARHFARQTLHRWHVPTPDEGQLVVAELAANALRHSGSGFSVCLSRRTHAVRVEVTDLGSTTPDLIETLAAAEADWGLRIVDHLATGWGCEFAPGRGKVVWAELQAV